MKSNELKAQISSIVDQAADEGVSLHTLEDILQAEAQHVREERRVYRVFVYECPRPNCEESTTQLVDQMELACDVCEAGLELTHSTLHDEVELMEFTCADHDVTRIHEFSRAEMLCSIHDEMMQLLRSRTTEEGLGR